jgi:serine/threonine protein kinase
LPKIADFGLSKDEKAGDVVRMAERTANIGTPIYMAPEVR